MRLNVYLAQAGVASRRKADDYIKEGRVSVNGQPGQLNSVVTQEDEIRLDGKRITLQHLRYILLFKPAGYLTSLKDPQGRKIVTDLVKIPERVVPVGRLDYDTTGLLLLTNDGELANALMHPSKEVDKVYDVEVDKVPNQQMLDLLSIGVMIDDKKTAPAKARLIGKNKIELVVHEGRKHQVKKMCSAVELNVKKLHRSQYAGLNLNGLKPGQWRDLHKHEVKTLYKMVE